MYVAVWSGEGNESIDEHHVLVFRWTVYMIAVSYPMQSLLAIPSFCLELQIFKDSVHPHRAPGPMAGRRSGPTADQTATENGSK